MKRTFAATVFAGFLLTLGAAQVTEAKTTFVTIGTGGITGVYYPTGGAIANMVNAKKDQYGIRATVEATGGSVFNINGVLGGDLEFGIAQSEPICRFGRRGCQSPFLRASGLTVLSSTSTRSKRMPWSKPAKAFR